MSGGQDEHYRDQADRREALESLSQRLYAEWLQTTDVREERENRAWALTQIDRFAGELPDQLAQFIRHCYRNQQPGVNVGLHERCTWLINKIRKTAKCEPLELLP